MWSARPTLKPADIIKKELEKLQFNTEEITQVLDLISKIQEKRSNVEPSQVIRFGIFFSPYISKIK